MNNPNRIVTYRILNGNEDMDLYRDLITDKVMNIIVNNESSLSLFRNANRESVYSYLHIAFMNESTIKIIGMFNERDELVAGCLITVDSPWYNDSFLFIEECVTISFVNGTGATGVVSEALEHYAKEWNADCILMSNANPNARKMISNTMHKKNWDSYETFYKMM